MKNQVFISLILTPFMLLLASTSAMSFLGYSGSWNAIAHIELQELVANEDSSDADNECDDPELVDCGRV